MTIEPGEATIELEPLSWWRSGAALAVILLTVAAVGTTLVQVGFLSEPRSLLVFTVLQYALIVVNVALFFAAAMVLILLVASRRSPLRAALTKSGLRLSRGGITDYVSWAEIEEFRVLQSGARLPGSTVMVRRRMTTGSPNPDELLPPAPSPTAVGRLPSASTMDDSRLDQLRHWTADKFVIDQRWRARSRLIGDPTEEHGLVGAQ